jgi:lysine decarboxylase
MLGPSIGRRGTAFTRQMRATLGHRNIVDVRMSATGTRASSLPSPAFNGVEAAEPTQVPTKKLAHNAPLLSAFVEKLRAKETPFTIPGHKRQANVVDPSGDLSLVVDGDVPLYGGLDTIKVANKTLAKAEKLFADAYQADWCRFSTGGATHANQAVILALCRPGDKVLVSRIVHRSMLSGILLAGLEPVWVLPRLHPEHGVPLGSMHPDDVEAALIRNPDIKAVLVVEPSYMGCSQDVAALAKVAHAHGAKIMVDQAWGAHFGWSSKLPPHAMAQGADAMVTSIHKTLPGYSASAVAIARFDNGLDKARLEQAFECSHTTSPAGAPLASIDACRALLVSEEGQRALDDLVGHVEHARQRLAEASVPTLSAKDFKDAASAGITFDNAKLVIRTGAIGISGVKVERSLIAAGIPVEMADKDYMVAIVTVCDTRADIDRLVDEIIESVHREMSLEDARINEVCAEHHATLKKDDAKSTGWEVMSEPQRVVGLRQAFFAPVEHVSAADAVGRASADLVAPYPPGIAVLAPGELITRHIVDSLQATVEAGVRVAYASDPTLKTYRVLKLDDSDYKDDTLR